MSKHTDTSETAIREMSIEEQVNLLCDSWYTYKLQIIDTEDARLKHVPGAVPADIPRTPREWVESLETLHHCWNREAMELFIAKMAKFDTGSTEEAKVQNANDREEPEAQSDINIVTQMEPEKLEEMIKKPKKNPIKKATKIMKKTGKKVIGTTGKVVGTAVKIVTFPITAPLSLSFYLGMYTGKLIADDEFDD